VAGHPRRYRIELTRAAADELAQLEKREQRRIARSIDALAENPRPRGAKKLHGGRNLWRIRVGDYRVIYTIRDEVLLVLVIKVGPRGDVYRSD